MCGGYFIWQVFDDFGDLLGFCIALCKPGVTLDVFTSFPIGFTGLFAIVGAYIGVGLLYARPRSRQHALIFTFIMLPLNVLAFVAYLYLHFHGLTVATWSLVISLFIHAILAALIIALLVQLPPTKDDDSLPSIPHKAA